MSNISRPHPHVLLQPFGVRFTAVDVSVLVDGDKLGAVSRGLSWIAPRIENERVHPSALGIPNPDAHLPARILHIVGLGIGDVDLVFAVEEDPARFAELGPYGERLPLLIEDLDSVVAAIADEYAPS